MHFELLVKLYKSKRVDQKCRLLCRAAMERKALVLIKRDGVG